MPPFRRGWPYFRHYAAIADAIFHAAICSAADVAFDIVPLFTPPLRCDTATEVLTGCMSCRRRFALPGHAAVTVMASCMHAAAAAAR